MTRLGAAIMAYVRSRLPLVGIFMLCLLAGSVAVLRMVYAIAFNPPRAWTLSIAFDQLANAAGNGDADETVSSRAGKARMFGRRWGCVLCKALDKLDPGHCDRFIERDRGRRLDVDLK